MIRSRTTKSVLAALLVTLLAGYVACSQKNDQPSAHLVSRDEDPGHGLHEVNNARLREIMHGLSSIEMERLQADAASGANTDARIERVARDAAQLASDARAMPHAYRNMEMSQESRRVFDTLARQLRTQCIELEQLARSGKTAALKGKMNEITNTCNSCHASFRGPQMAMGK